MCFVLAVPLQHLATDPEGLGESHRTSSSSMFFIQRSFFFLHTIAARPFVSDRKWSKLWGLLLQGELRFGERPNQGTRTVWWWEWKSNDRAGGAAPSKGDGRHGPVFREIANMEDATIPRRARRAADTESAHISSVPFSPTEESMLPLSSGHKLAKEEGPGALRFFQRFVPWSCGTNLSSLEAATAAHTCGHVPNSSVRNRWKSCWLLAVHFMAHTSSTFHRFWWILDWSVLDCAGNTADIPW